MQVDLLPFLTFSDDNPDFNEDDERRDIEEMILRNDAVESFIKGEMSGDELLGIVDESGIPADEYFETAIDNMIVSMGRHYLPCKSGLLLPV